ncbi:hypothetical protein HX92_0981 [Mycobacterium tuberculosis]|nr:hypothetical protein GS11_2526 [Mycobacterium tuberculosis variant bovis BCG]AOZ43671.1 PE family protein [Mycobacterium tuberculosis]KDA16569.1 hypothetical protein CO60_0019 [Mycobacterium tuberculosis]KQL75092.1 hypothetical protein HX92_0981 [Mycobacterium tuberculosis]
MPGRPNGFLPAPSSPPPLPPSPCRIPLGPLGAPPRRRFLGAVASSVHPSH